VLLAGAAAFVEKPISCLPLAEVLPYADEVRRVAAQRSLPISVGYMFRCVAENPCLRSPSQTLWSPLAPESGGDSCCIVLLPPSSYHRWPHRLTSARSLAPADSEPHHFCLTLLFTLCLPISIFMASCRYSKPVQTIRELIAKHAPGKVCCFNARYNAAVSVPAATPHCLPRYLVWRGVSECQMFQNVRCDGCGDFLGCHVCENADWVMCCVRD
jgi:hypothetical protein